MRASKPIPFASTFVATAFFVLSGCSESDTIVSLNLTSAPQIGIATRTIQVRIEQPGRAPFTTSFAQPSALEFYKRLRLPDDWEKKLADLEAQALDGNGTVLASDSAEVLILPQGAVVAFVEFAADEEPPPGGEAGAGGASGAGGSDSDAGAGGTSSDAGAAGGSSDAGAGGTLGEGGAPSEGGATEGGAAGNG